MEDKQGQEQYLTEWKFGDKKGLLHLCKYLCTPVIAQADHTRDDTGALIVPDVSPIIPPNPGGFGGGDNGGNGTITGGTLPGATGGGAPSAGAIVGILIGVLAALVRSNKPVEHAEEIANVQILLYYFFRKYGRPAVVKPPANNVNKWDAANNLQAMKQEAVLVTTVAEQRYVYRKLLYSLERIRWSC
jgi:hypothetical protein